MLYMAYLYVVFISAVFLPPYIVSTLHHSALLSFSPLCLLLNQAPRFVHMMLKMSVRCWTKLSGVHPWPPS